MSQLTQTKYVLRRLPEIYNELRPTWPGIPVPVIGQPAKQDDHGQTLATITPGDWTLANQQQDLSGLNADAAKANNTVDPFDIDKPKAAQQSAAALSVLLDIGVAELSQKLGFDEGHTLEAGKSSRKQEACSVEGASRRTTRIAQRLPFLAFTQDLR
jgi:hypothetical protein